MRSFSDFDEFKKRMVRGAWTYTKTENGEVLVTCKRPKPELVADARAYAKRYMDAAEMEMMKELVQMTYPQAIERAQTMPSVFRSVACDDIFMGTFRGHEDSDEAVETHRKRRKLADHRAYQECIETSPTIVLNDVLGYFPRCVPRVVEGYYEQEYEATKAYPDQLIYRRHQFMCTVRPRSNEEMCAVVSIALMDMLRENAKVHPNPTTLTDVEWYDISAVDRTRPFHEEFPILKCFLDPTIHFQSVLKGASGFGIDPMTNVFRRTFKRYGSDIGPFAHVEESGIDYSPLFTTRAIEGPTPPIFIRVKV